MKLLLFVVSLCLIKIFTGCTPHAPKVYELKANCNQPTEELFNSIIQITSKHNFTPKVSDSKIGLLVVETEPSSLGKKSNIHKEIWQFNYINGKLLAYAKQSITETDTNGHHGSMYTLSFNDKTKEEELWYWNVRNELQHLCPDIKVTE
ncbi:MAG: hypothetical protein JNJ85_06780 [Candidatus Kapabacteria bacterium]|nr:hypothetical protein [Candidatus Kapabacteria bacterium]